MAWMMLALILGVPTFIAFRAYQRMLVRSQVVEGSNLAKPRLAAVEAYWQRHGVFPMDDREAGVRVFTPDQGHWVQRVGIADGTVTIAWGTRANEQVAGHALVYAPRVEDGALRWECGSAAGTTLEIAVRPNACRH